jgi:hypothetical protein
MSRGKLLSLYAARARVDEIRRELREIYRTFPELRVVRANAISRIAAKANADIAPGGQRQQTPRQWVQRR